MSGYKRSWPWKENELLDKNETERRTIGIGGKIFVITTEWVYDTWFCRLWNKERTVLLAELSSICEPSVEYQWVIEAVLVLEAMGECESIPAL